jgi:hypothetical protein
MTATTDTTRNAGLAELRDVLVDQQGRKHDVVATATALRYVGGQLQVRGAEPELSEDGVTTVDGTYQPTRNFDQQIAAKLGIDGRYARKLRDQRIDLLDANVNAWLHGRTRRTAGGGTVVVHPADPRKFLIRTLRGADDSPAIARALLSNRYGVIDHLDVLTAAMEGIQDTGIHVDVAGCDLTDDRMFVRLVAPEVAADVTELLKGYRSPFSGLGAHDAMNRPVAFAGLHLGNSETGGGAFTITPRAIVQVCTNGLTVTQDVQRAVHVGGRLDEGTVTWSRDTERKQLALIKSKTADTVRTFLSLDYWRDVIDGITEQAAKPVPATTAVQTVGKSLKYSQEQIDGVLDHFIRGGQTTAGGVMQAVTSYAQVIRDPEAAHELESSALQALQLAASL